MNTAIRRCTALACAGLLAMGLTACGDDDDEASPTIDEVKTTTADDAGDDAPEGETVVVTAVDYGFDGLPESVEAGTKLSLRNEGAEPHELVAMRIPDDETRSLDELLQLPEDELGAVFGAGEPATVLLAATGETDVPGPVVGDGTLSEPGRYAIVCFLPVGSDDSVLESEGPPQGDAPPHVSQGMAAELVVS